MELSTQKADRGEKMWYVMRAYKKEKTAEEKLNEINDIEYFIPKHYVTRTYHGKVKKELVPIMASIIFVHASRIRIEELKKAYPFFQYIVWNTHDGNKKFIIVPDKQMNDFITVASQYEQDIIFYKPEDIKFEKGTKVRVHGGIFDGIEGTFIKVAGKRRRRVVIIIDNIAAVAAAEIIPEYIELITDETKHTNK